MPQLNFDDLISKPASRQLSYDDLSFTSNPRVSREVNMFNKPSPSYPGELGDWDMSSQYDYTNMPGQNIEENRAQLQTNWDRLGNGLARLGVTTGTKLGSGLGYLFSAPLALAEWNIETMTDNVMSTMFDNAEESFKEAMPIYHTKEYDDSSPIGKLGHMSWWTEDFVDGVAFLASMYAPGLALAKVGAGAKLLYGTSKALGASVKATKAGRVLDVGTKVFGKTIAPNLDKIGKTLDLAHTTLQASLMESAFESHAAGKELETMMRNQLNPKTGEVFTEADIKDAVRDAKVGTFWSNMAILTLSNSIEARALMGMMKTTPRVIGLAGTPIEKATFKSGLKAGAMASLKTSAAEGAWEENIQLAISDYEKNKGLTGDKGQGRINELAKNWAKNWTTDEGQSNIIAGAVVGLLPGTYGGVKQNQRQIAEDNNVRNVINRAAMLAHTNPLDFYKKDENDKLILEDGKPVFDINALHNAYNNLKDKETKAKVIDTLYGKDKALFTIKKVYSEMANDFLNLKDGDKFLEGHLKHRAQVDAEMYAKLKEDPEALDRVIASIPEIEDLEAKIQFFQDDAIKQKLIDGNTRQIESLKEARAKQTDPTKKGKFTKQINKLEKQNTEYSQVKDKDFTKQVKEELEPHIAKLKELKEQATKEAKETLETNDFTVGQLEKTYLGWANEFKTIKQQVNSVSPLLLLPENSKAGRQWQENRLSALYYNAVEQKLLQDEKAKAIEQKMMVEQSIEPSESTTNSKIISLNKRIDSIDKAMTKKQKDYADLVDEKKSVNAFKTDTKEKEVEQKAYEAVTKEKNNNDFKSKLKNVTISNDGLIITPATIDKEMKGNKDYRNLYDEHVAKLKAEHRAKQSAPSTDNNVPEVPSSLSLTGQASKDVVIPDSSTSKAQAPTVKTKEEFTNELKTQYPILNQPIPTAEELASIPKDILEDWDSYAASLPDAKDKIEKMADTWTNGFPIAPKQEQIVFAYYFDKLLTKAYEQYVEAQPKTVKEEVKFTQNDAIPEKPDANTTTVFLSGIIKNAVEVIKDGDNEGDTVIPDELLSVFEQLRNLKEGDVLQVEEDTEWYNEHKEEYDSSNDKPYKVTLNGVKLVSLNSTDYLTREILLTEQLLNNVELLDGLLKDLESADRYLPTLEKYFGTATTEGLFKGISLYESKYYKNLFENPNPNRLEDFVQHLKNLLTYNNKNTHKYNLQVWHNRFTTDLTNTNKIKNNFAKGNKTIKVTHKSPGNYVSRSKKRRSVLDVFGSNVKLGIVSRGVLIDPINDKELDVAITLDNNSRVIYLIDDNNFNGTPVAIPLNSPVTSVVDSERLVATAFMAIKTIQDNHGITPEAEELLSEINDFYYKSNKKEDNNFRVEYAASTNKVSIYFTNVGKNGKPLVFRLELKNGVNEVKVRYADKSTYNVVAVENHGSILVNKYKTLHNTKFKEDVKYRNKILGELTTDTNVTRNEKGEIISTATVHGNYPLTIHVGEDNNIEETKIDENNEVVIIKTDKKKVVDPNEDEEYELVTPIKEGFTSQEVIDKWNDINGENIIDAITLAIASTTDEHYLKLLNNLLSKRDNIYDVIFEIDTILNKDGKVIPAVYTVNSKNQRVITLNKNLFNTTTDSNYITRVLTHELVHAFLVESISNPQTPAQYDFSEIVKSYYEAYKNLKSDEYGFKNENEFVAEIISNPKFVESLYTTEERGELKLGTLNKIINWIRSIFGYPNLVRPRNVITKIDTVKQNDINEFKSYLLDYILSDNSTFTKFTPGEYNLVVPIFTNLNSNDVQYSFEATDILLSDKAKQIFDKGKKNNWSLDKILTELAIPKEQKQLILDLGITDREQLALDLSSKYGFSVEVNIAKDASEKAKNDSWDRAVEQGLNPWDTGIVNDFQGEPTQYYSSLTVPGGSNYTENEISTPLITPSIKGHAQFSTNNGIGWFRSDDKIDNALIEDTRDPQIELDENGNYVQVQYGKLSQTGGKLTKTRRILEIQSDLFQKGRDKEDLTNNKPDVILPIGTSGSGKSTFIKSLPQENLVVIEPDAMRVEFTGDINNKSKDKEIYEEAAKRAITAIKQGKQVVFDTTNLTKDKRLPFIEAIKKEIPDANIQYKLMPLNPELAKQRIKAQLERGENRANVSDSTIDRHAESYKQMLEDIKNEPISNYENSSNQFLQLLNKDNNWVAFFIKSIMQDSAKKGYEKVLFPKGETAAKIEGHQTIANEIIHINQEIKSIENKNIEETAKILEKKGIGNYEVNLKELEEDRNKKLSELNSKKQELKSQGIEKLKPIEAFYEIKVGNILEKQFGKDNVKTIIDEYSNEWREIDINNLIEIEKRKSNYFQSKQVDVTQDNVTQDMDYVDNLSNMSNQEVEEVKRKCK